MKVLVTGATGYVGGRLIPRLLDRGDDVTVLVRNLQRIQGRAWLDKVRVIEADLLSLNADSLSELFDTAFYLVHSMTDSSGFSDLEAKAAANFSKALNLGCHIVYLGGIQPEGDHLSDHLQSRIAVGKILRATHAVTELRAGPIIGSGSASFEMMRNLTERLPLMIAPKWVKHWVRPVAIRDVLDYLLRASVKRWTGCLDIGGEPIRFIDMMSEWAKLRGFRRLIIPVPVLAPGLAARWVGLVTPITNKLAVPIIKGMRTSIVGDTRKAQEVFPEVAPMSYPRAIELALKRIEVNFIETRWSGALGSGSSFVLEEKEGIIHETRTMKSSASAEAVFNVFVRAGGENGWFAWNWAWRIRGAIDRFIGGPGTRRGRRHPVEIFAGEAVDFWRVEEVVPGRSIRLYAEMKVPGDAWLQWEVVDGERGNGSVLTQTAFFNPSGISGRLYWVALYPVHGFIFSGMIKNILKRAESLPEIESTASMEASVNS